MECVCENVHVMVCVCVWVVCVRECDAMECVGVVCVRV